MKGGVGKTTSVVELGTILATEHEKKVLIIDIDPQTNSTFSLIGLDEWGKIKDTATIADVLGMNKGLSSRDTEYDIKDAIIENVCEIENLDLIPSHIELTFLDIDLSSEPGRENILSRQIEKLTTNYDFVLIDCPPNLTIAPQNALVVSDHIIVPVSPEFYAAIGLPLLINRVNQLKRKSICKQTVFYSIYIIINSIYKCIFAFIVLVLSVYYLFFTSLNFSFVKNSPIDS